MLDPIRRQIRVHGGPAQVFTRFVELSRWWPMAYTRSGARFAGAYVEPEVGGRWYETDLDGGESAWGDVRAYDPGHRLVVGFNVSADRGSEPPERQSEVEVTFEAEGDETVVSLEHRDLAKHGKGAEAIAQGMGSDHGWPLILASFEREMRLTA